MSSPLMFEEKVTALWTGPTAKQTESNVTATTSTFAHSPPRYDRMRWSLHVFITEALLSKKYSLRKLRKTNMFIIWPKVSLITIIYFRVFQNQNIHSLQTAPLSCPNSLFYCAESLYCPVPFSNHFLSCLQYLKACFEDQSGTEYTERVTRRALTLYCLIR